MLFGVLLLAPLAVRFAFVAGGAASKGVEMLTRGGIYGGLLLAFLVPALLLTAFRVTVHFTGPKKEGTSSADDPADRPQDEP